MGKEITPFSFSAGERKIMAHFVVRKGSSKNAENIEEQKFATATRPISAARHRQLRKRSNTPARGSLLSSRKIFFCTFELGVFGSSARYSI